MSILSNEQLATLRTAPLGNAPNKLALAFTLANVKQTEAAAETGLTDSTISKLVRGAYQSVNVDSARELAVFFGCAIEDLFPAKAEAV